MTDHLDTHTDIDGELLALAKELSFLSDIDVPGVSRERTWAKVRSHTRSGEGAAQSGLLGWLRSGRYRWALAPVAAALVAALSLVAVESRGQQPRVAERTSTSTHGTAVLPGGGVVTPTGPTAHVTTSTTKATVTTTRPTATTKSVGRGSGSTASSTTRTTSRGGGGPTALRPPSGGSATRTRPTATNPSPSSTDSPTTEPQTTTTEPTTTTLEQAVLDAQREDSARSVVSQVARRVLAGHADDAAGLVSGEEAQEGLVILDAALKNPQRYDIVEYDYSADGDKATVVVQFIDLIPDGSGGLAEVRRLFYFKVRVDDEGATVVGIYRG